MWTLLDLAGSVALLLWGLHMVQTGIQRGFGPDLRRRLSCAGGTRRAFDEPVMAGFLRPGANL
jgi:Na+/phosphate symporter